MEDEVVAWISDLSKKGVTVSGGMIQRRATICFEELYSSEIFTFKASIGWLDRFIKRHDLSCRVVTSTGQKVPSNAADLAKGIISFLLNKRESKGLPPDAIGNMDETPMWFDLPASKSYDFKVVKVVSAKTNGKEKLGYPVVLAAKANGAKLPPLIIFKGLKQEPKGFFPSDIRVEVSCHGKKCPGKKVSGRTLFTG